MTMTLLTCVACGKKLLVRDEPAEQPNEQLDRKCSCSQSMVEKRRRAA